LHASDAAETVMRWVVSAYFQLGLLHVQHDMSHAQLLMGERPRPTQLWVAARQWQFPGAAVQPVLHLSRRFVF
jgi:hypothetical protein